MGADLDSLTQIRTLLAEPVSVAAERELKTFAQQLAGTDGSVVLFGAGRLGRLCARALERAGVPVKAYCDGNSSLHGTKLEAIDVMSPQKAAERFGGTSLFIVAIWTGTARESMVERGAFLRGLGCRRVVPFGPLIWAWGRDETPFHSFDLPTRILTASDAILRLAEVLGDEESRRVLLVALRQRLLAEFAAGTPSGDQYFPNELVKLTDHEIVVDGGAFDGDTLAEFLARTGSKIGHYHAFEPDPLNREKLERRVAEFASEVRERISIHPIALSDRDELLAFSNSGGQAAQRSEEGAKRVQALPMDRIVSEHKISWLKLDVEGAERAALEGARKIIARDRPLCAVCVYHGPSDLWEIPRWLERCLPSSRLFVRQYGFDGWETVCYAIPPDRLEETCGKCSPSASPRSCPVCESTRSREVLHRQRFFEGPLGDGYDVVVCGNCGAGFADGIPAQAELNRYYAERSKYTYAHSDGLESSYDFKRFEVIAEQLGPYLLNKSVRILDIGCATGGLLAVLKRRGYTQVEGSDPSPACRAAAGHLHGIQVHTATLEDHASWTETFDVVLLVGVLEHLRDVLSAVRVASRLLRPRGILFCAQPDVEAFPGCINAPFQQFSVEHVNFFSRNSLLRLMGAAGLAPKETWRWMVEWREGITDSVISGVFSRGDAVMGRDEITGPALREYVRVSASQEEGAQRRIEAFVQSQEPVLVWGVGTLTRRLLKETSLSRANITAFVDSQIHMRGALLAGRPIWQPSELAGHSETILLGSVAFEHEILRLIREQLRLPNPVVTFFGE